MDGAVELAKQVLSQLSDTTTVEVTVTLRHQLPFQEAFERSALTA